MAAKVTEPYRNLSREELLDKAHELGRPMSKIPTVAPSAPSPPSIGSSVFQMYW